MALWPRTASGWRTLMPWWLWIRSWKNTGVLEPLWKYHHPLLSVRGNATMATLGSHRGKVCELPWFARRKKKPKQLERAESPANLWGSHEIRTLVLCRRCTRGAPVLGNGNGAPVQPLQCAAEIGHLLSTNFFFSGPCDNAPIARLCRDVVPSRSGGGAPATMPGPKTPSTIACC